MHTRNEQFLANRYRRQIGVSGHSLVASFRLQEWMDMIELVTSAARRERVL